VIVQTGEIDTMVNTKALALVHQHLQPQATVSAYQDWFVLLTIMTLAVCPWYCSCVHSRRIEAALL
jgi:hypothetical protein